MTLAGGRRWLGSELSDIVNSCQSTLGKLRGIRGITYFFIFFLSIMTLVLTKSVKVIRYLSKYYFSTCGISRYSALYLCGM